MDAEAREFREQALQVRFVLLRSLAFFQRQAGQGPAATAYDLTQVAIRCGFVGPRKPVSGAVLDGWIRDRNPPAWAVKAAVVMLFEVDGYTPSYEEMVAIGLVLAELFPEDSAEGLRGHLPERWLDLGWEPVLGLACEARKRRVADR